MHLPFRLPGRFQLPVPGLALLAWAASLPAQPHSTTPAVPDGFSISVFAAGLDAPGAMSFGPDGRLYVTLGRQGRVVSLADLDGDGTAEDGTVVVEGLDRPFGIAWHEGEIWVAEMTRVTRIAVSSSANARHVVVLDSLPGGAHRAPAITFDPSDTRLFLAIATSCALCREDNPLAATIVRYQPTTGDAEVWARGLRSSPGLAFNPETGELWATEAGRPDLGDGLPADELNAVHRGRDYGWPFCYGARVASPEYADPARCDGTRPPIFSFPAGSTPLGMEFYTGAMFPEDYSGDLFVALHGSPGRPAPCGVVRLRIQTGRAVAVENFASGWLVEGGGVIGRPVQPLVGPDGALYISDDDGGRIWRVTYNGRG